MELVGYEDVKTGSYEVFSFVVVHIFCYADKERLPSENNIVAKCFRVIRA